MAKRTTLRIPIDFKQTVTDLLKVKPPEKPPHKKRVVRAITSKTKKKG